ncbi:alpha/beta fold hydrolase [Raineyella fluvialis]|uniref:Alpha/beta fold hydrolase n=1 Tax=Raineyella fluvialis TaxID=2662261 RepID=A0A5Q2FAQ7_9ACTN|nr:alpha/beta hydrolase [Raineyella fluvialis]QGF23471.1 alpha/beta fold hydrolase [Raineyella fluvialis]
MPDGSMSTDLYHEVRGQGPAVLFIPGAFGDAGQFAGPAERLADEFTVITYDRRGFSRSRQGSDRPDSASVSAQADDAARLITVSGVDRAMVFGTSFGANIVLDLVARHPEVVTAAIVHEPPLRELLPPIDLPNPTGPVIQLARTDPSAAVEAMIRTMGSDEGWEAIEPATRARISANGEYFFGREFGTFSGYVPDTAAIRATGVPVQLLLSAHGGPMAPPVIAILAERLGAPIATISGSHMPFGEAPTLFADELRPILERLAA